MAVDIESSLLSQLGGKVFLDVRGYGIKNRLSRIIRDGDLSESVSRMYPSPITTTITKKRTHLVCSGNGTHDAS